MSQSLKSDLFIENGGLAMAGRIRFPDAALEIAEGFDILHAEHTQFEYHTIICGEIWQASLEMKMKLGGVCDKIISHYLTKHGIGNSARILTVGLGNAEIVADSLGPMICKKITPTAGVSTSVRSVYTLAIGTAEKSGFETSSLIRALCNLINADIVICADSLTAATRDRLHGVIQISDVGIFPGSAVSNRASEVSSHTIGVPVLSVGVPMAIREDVLTGATVPSPLLVTRANSDVICDTYATIIAHGMRKAFFGNNGQRSNT